MATLTRLVIHRKGIQALLSEPGVAADLASRAARVAAAADAAAGHGAVHRVEVEAGASGVRRGTGGRFVNSTKRARAAVITDNLAARKAEATKHTLIRAFGAAR